MRDIKRTIQNIASDRYFKTLNHKQAFDRLVKFYMDVIDQINEFYNVLSNVKDGKDGINGSNGVDGKDGKDGSNGKSAYEVAVNEGFEGDITAWLASLKGETGDIGPQGQKGEQGEQGEKGDTGNNGESAYEIAVRLGFKGTEKEWLDTFYEKAQEAIRIVEDLFQFDYTFNFVTAEYVNKSFNITGNIIGNQWQLKDCKILYLGAINTAATYPQEGVQNANGYRPSRDTMLKITKINTGTYIDFQTRNINASSLLNGSTNLELVEETESGQIHNIKLKSISNGDATLTLRNLNYTYYINIKIYSNSPTFVYKSDFDDLVRRVEELENR